MVRRRSVLGGAATAAGVLAGSAGLAACGPDERAAPPFDPASWASVKAQFPHDRSLANLSAYVFSSHPAPVRTAIDGYAAALDRDPLAALDGEGAVEQKLREAAAGHLGGSPDDIAFTDSTTAGLGLLYSGLKLAPGDEILTTEHDFYATHESLRLLAARTGVSVRRVRLYTDPATASAETMVSALAAALTPKVAVVALTWVHSGTGVKLPVAALAAEVRARTGALVCLDAVHGFGACLDKPGDLGVDFFVSGGHKWLFGPRGTGVVWGTPQAWRRYTPVVPTFERAAIGAWITGRSFPVTAGAAATPGGYHSFEHRWALTDAFGFHRRIGPQRVAARTTELATRLKDGLAGLDHVTLHTPRGPDLSAGIVCCEVRGVDPARAVARLRGEKVVATVTPYPTALLRFGPSIAADTGDVDRAVAAVRGLR